MEMKLHQRLKNLYTDYPITELGDEEGTRAPIRKCEAIAYDNDKYMYVRINGTNIIKEIKRGYIYTIPLRLPGLGSDNYGYRSWRARKVLFNNYLLSHKQLNRAIRKGYIKKSYTVVGGVFNL